MLPAKDVTFAYIKFVARAGDDPLDEVHPGFGVFRFGARLARTPAHVRHGAQPLLGVARRMEDRDLPHVRIAEVHADAVHEHALAD